MVNYSEGKPEMNHPVTAGPVFTGRAANVVPPSHYLLPSSDQDLPEDARALLRYHPIQYVLLNRYTGEPERDGRFNRCPCCEQWSPCDVRTLAEQGHLEEAERLHVEREWPANSGAAKRFRGMKPDYSRVVWRKA